ncbi:M3 family oligoendopeptidase [Cohnella thailandensis]|uniref:M3 family oligoendopeptidase n=1 Tax=Cohnella thailandensis TaxID=557557 RepID=A0A841SSB0_9BACL|nr:M3 family oligoendopeptidase [Cohnella thailandensis]MBB6632800.1 M3 family oligoendopeptidase [Cohnella thailandensis]MBP1975508.1 pepF/M3 family oligoendopeptidase [Cohnella thailandensis]
MNTPSLTWDLEVLFPGGSESKAFAAFMEESDKLVQELLQELKRSVGAADEEQLAGWTGRLQEANLRIRQADSFTACLTSQNTDDKRAAAWTEKVQTLSSRYSQASNLFDVKLSELPDDRWEKWVTAEERKEISFLLNERREAVREKLPPELEGLASELAINGYHGWGDHYSLIVSRIGIPWEENGEAKKLSVGQASNKLSHPSQEVRDRMAARWEEAWTEQEDLAADVLNRLSGFRLKLYGKRGWDSVLQEPLRINRMSRETLESMWAAVEGSIEPLQKYLSVKAGLLGKEKLGWHDVGAPVGKQGESIAYGEAAKLIYEAFSQFSPSMAGLAERAFAERWIEVEDRAGKRPGGFCTDFPINRQTRIFMTYSGTMDNVSTLAHELGHAYHSSLVDGLAPFAQDYAMNVAETASTFAEAIVSDALLRKADGAAEKLALLNVRLESAVAFCMNIRARFLFETRFYEKRKEGMLEAEQIKQLMIEAQKEAYGDSLESWHPTFWASKLHFYITDVPFYNFPYSFGYLFSTGILAAAEKEGPSFNERYDALLKDTAVMTVEDLARKHLGVDLTKPDFWEAAVAKAVSDVELFAKYAVEIS